MKSKIKITRAKQRLGTLRSIYFWLIISVITGMIFYKGARKLTTNYLLKMNAVQTQAVIIDQRNYMGNSPVSKEYAYSYAFEIEGKLYTGNSFNSKLQIGDTVSVQYVSFWPQINKINNDK